MPGPSCLLLHLFRVPLACSTVAAQVLANGCGALWIDGCRVGLQGIQKHATSASAALGDGNLLGKGGSGRNAIQEQRLKAGGNPRYEPAGRWPPNLLLVHHPECIQTGTRSVPSHNPGNKSTERVSQRCYGVMESRPLTGYAVGGQETVASWQCHPTCPCGLLDRQSGVSLSTGGRNRNITPSGVYGAGKGLGSSSAGIQADQVRGDPGFGDTGGASRFYPGFTDLAECLAWVDRLINGPESSVSPESV